jgi:hypothetical protein
VDLEQEESLHPTEPEESISDPITPVEEQEPEEIEPEVLEVPVE